MVKVTAKDVKNAVGDIPSPGVKDTAGKTRYVSKEEAATEGSKVKDFFGKKNRKKSNKEPIMLAVEDKEFNINDPYEYKVARTQMRRSGLSEDEINDRISEALGEATIKGSDKKSMDAVSGVRGKGYSEAQLSADRKYLAKKIKQFEDENGAGSYAELSDEEKNEFIKSALERRDYGINKQFIKNKSGKYAEYNEDAYDKALTLNDVSNTRAPFSTYSKGMTRGELNSLKDDLKEGIKTLEDYREGKVGIDAVEALDNTKVGKILRAGRPDLYEGIEAGGNGGKPPVGRKTASADDDLPRGGQSSVPESRDADVKEKKKRFISPMEAALGGAAIGGAGLGIGALAAGKDDDDEDFKRMMMLQMMRR